MSRLHLVLVGCGALVAAGCHDVPVRGVVRELVASTDAISFAQTPVGSSREARIVLTNRGPMSMQLEVSSTVDEFDAPDRLHVSGGEQLDVWVRFTPSREGEHEGELRLSTGEGTLTLRLSGVGIAASCAAPAACQRAVVRDDSCVMEPEQDGAACASPCVQQGTCKAGVCVGDAASCDDGDLCTVDACGATGCTHAPLACEQPENPCMVARCDPATGCVTEAAPDGTSCGRSDRCDVRDVCVAGACVERPVPEGASCGRDTVCQAKGTCTQGRCVLPPARTFPRISSFELSRAGGGIVLDDQNNAYFAVNYHGAGTSLVSVDPAGKQRWSSTHDVEAMLWHSGRLIALSAGRTTSAYDAKPAELVAFDADGTELWAKPLSDYAPASWDQGSAGSRVWGSGLAVNASGNLHVDLSGKTKSASGVWAEAGAWFLTVDPATGALLSRTTPHSVGGWRAFDEHGASLWFRTETSSTPGVPGLHGSTALAGVSATGSSWTASMAELASVAAVADGLALIGSGDACYSEPRFRVLDLATGAIRTTIPMAARPVATADRIWLGGSRMTSRTPNAPYECRFETSWTGVSVLDANTLTVVGETELAASMTAPVLTSFGTALTIVGDSEGPWKVVEIGPDGSVVSECDATFYNPVEVTLGDGLLFIHEPSRHTDGNGMGVYAAPGLGPSPSGWSGLHANPHRTRRAGK